MSDSVSVDPGGNIESASLSRYDGDSIRLVILAREPDAELGQTAPPILHAWIHADLVAGEWVLTLSDSGSHGPQVRQADRFGREWRLSWDRESV